MCFSTRGSCPGPIYRWTRTPSRAGSRIMPLKLRLAPGKGVPISVLNLRCDIGGARSAALERDITLLLESRLSAVPEYVVLERRHAGALGFERSLDSEASTLPPGSCLLDGTFGLPTPGTGELTVRLRLRGPSAGAAPLEVTGREDDLPGLAEKLTAAIQQATGRTDDPPVWQPEKEAQRIPRRSDLGLAAQRARRRARSRRKRGTPRRKIR